MKLLKQLFSHGWVEACANGRVRERERERHRERERERERERDRERERYRNGNVVSKCITLVAVLGGTL